MKNLKRTMIILAFACLTVVFAFAQGEKPNREDVEQKMKVLKISFITEQLALNEEEAKTFWPVYNSYEEEMKSLRPKREQGKPDLSELTDEEIEQMITDRFNTEFKQLQLRERYFENFKQVLPLQKIIQLYKAEHDFKKEIIAKFKESKQGPPQD